MAKSVTWDELKKKVVNGEELATILGITRQRVSQLKKKQVLMSERDGFSLVDNVQRYLKFIASPQEFE